MTDSQKIFFKIIICLFFFVGFKVYGQSLSADSLKTIYEKQTIYLQRYSYGLFGRVKINYIKNNEAKRIGYLGKNLNEEFQHLPMAQLEMQNYKKHINTGRLMFVTELIILGVGIAIIPSINNQIPYPNSLILVAGISLIPAHIGSNNLKKAGNDLNKAVWLYNRDVLMEKLK